MGQTARTAELGAWSQEENVKIHDPVSAGACRKVMLPMLVGSPPASGLPTWVMKISLSHLMKLIETGWLIGQYSVNIQLSWLFFYNKTGRLVTPHIKQPMRFFSSQDDFCVASSSTATALGIWKNGSREGEELRPWDYCLRAYIYTHTYSRHIYIYIHNYIYIYNIQRIIHIYIYIYILHL
jgi:hypothetical protein